MRNIFMSCGHNNARNWLKNENWKFVLWFSRDQGAIDPKNPFNTEYKWVRKVANSLFQLVASLPNKEYVIILVPENLNLDDRIKWINSRSNSTDVCIELHMNAGGGTGTEVFAHSWSLKAMSIAANLSTILANSMGLRNRWAKPDTATRFGRLGFIRDTKPMAFLIELGFIDNEVDYNAVWTKGATSLKLALWSIRW